MDIMDQITKLREKQTTAKEVLAKAKAQREHLEERRDEMVKELKDEFNVTAAQANAKLKSLEKEADTLLSKAKEKLDSIKL